MKNKILMIVLTPAVLAVAVSALFIPEVEVTAEYKSRVTPESKAQSAAGAAEYLELLHTNVKTGKVEPTDFVRARQEVEAFAARKGGGPGLTWTEMGPDNSGGRCRAIQIDPSAMNVIYAGGVSGGLFKTNDNGNLWFRVESFEENLAVASIEIAGNGYIYVGTGSVHHETAGAEGSGGAGNGVYVSADNGATWQRIDAMTPGPISSNGPGGTGDWTAIDELWADPVDPEKIWVGSNAGLFTYTTANASAPNTGTLTPVQKANGSTNWNQIEDMYVSAQGNNFVVIETNKTWVSNDGGTTFANVSGNGAGQIPSSGVNRIEVAISPQDESWVYACAGDGNFMQGVYHSQDGGNTWDVINPGGAFQSDPFATADGSRGQAWWDMCITVSPVDKGQILVGGIRLFTWKQATNNPSFGQWEQSATQFAQQFGGVHADIHEFEWNDNGVLYIGTDGGVYISTDINNLEYYAANRGFNCAQFYGIAHNAYGHVFGGTQDNGMFLLNQQGNTYQEAIFSSSGIGDGFTTEMSHYFPDVMFGTAQFGFLDRSNDGGVSFNTFYNGPISTVGTPGTNLGPFASQIAMWETMDDPNSPDSLLWIVNTDNVLDTAGHVYAPGDTVWYTSSTQSAPLYHILTQSYTVADATDTVDILNTDTVSLVDPIQSLFAIGFNSGQGVWVTRTAMRFSATPTWYRIMDGNTGGSPNFGGETVKTLEWSKDGDHLYVGTVSGELWRVSGFSNAYSYDEIDIAGNNSQLTYARIRSGLNSGVLSGINEDPNDPDHLVITTGGFGSTGHVFETFDATTAGHNSNTFTSIQGDLPDIPAYSVVVDMGDPTGNTIVVGTEFGVFATDDGGSSWFDQNATMDRVPVHDMTQQWRVWGDGPTTNAGVIYLGTHGRGVWKTESLVSAEDVDGGDLGAKFETNLSVYPNPVRDISTIEFELENQTDVIINVYDINGRTVQSMNLQGMNAGINQVQINASNWNAGNYFVRLESATTVEVAKIVVSK